MVKSSSSDKISTISVGVQLYSVTILLRYRVGFSPLSRCPVFQLKMTWCLLLPLLALIAPSQGLSVVTPACARCVQPEFPPGSGRALYLPHCVQGVTHNYCDAVCTGE